jgi:hypothetical protein
VLAVLAPARSRRDLHREASAPEKPPPPATFAFCETIALDALDIARSSARPVGAMWEKSERSASARRKR